MEYIDVAGLNSIALTPTELLQQLDQQGVGCWGRGRVTLAANCIPCPSPPFYFLIVGHGGEGASSYRWHAHAAPWARAHTPIAIKHTRQQRGTGQTSRRRGTAAHDTRQHSVNRRPPAVAGGICRTHTGTMARYRPPAYGECAINHILAGWS